MTVVSATPAFARPRLDVGKAFKGGWNAFTADIVPLLVGTLIAGLLSIVTLGILAGPLTAGVYNMVIRRVRDGRRAEIGDVFSCMDRFWAFLWAAIVLVVLIGLASLTIVGGVLLATIWIYVFPFMVDRRMGLADAMSASYHQVVDNGFWEHLALLVIFVAIGAVANGWVGIVSTPFTIAVIVGAYFVAGGRGGLIDHPPAPQPPTPSAMVTTGPAPQPPAPSAAPLAPAAPITFATGNAPAMANAPATPDAPVMPSTPAAPDVTVAPSTPAAPDVTVSAPQATVAPDVEPAGAETTSETAAEAPAAPTQPAESAVQQPAESAPEA